MLVSHENGPLQELLMGVETPIPPKIINAAAPEGTPPSRIKTVKIIIYQFSCIGGKFPFVYGSPQPNLPPNLSF